MHPGDGRTPAAGRRRRLAAALRRRSPFVWGLLDQGFSSATTFVFTTIAARSLGPSGLGAIALGYAMFLIALGLERALIVDPLIARVSASARSADEALRSAATVTILLSLALAGLAAVAAETLPLGSSHGMILFAPWLLPALAHTLLRAWLYREGRGGSATAANAAWLVVLVALVAAGLRSTDWQITAAWGLGACAALAVAVARTEHRGLASPRVAGGWFVHEALRLGTWLAASGVFFSAATYARVAGMSSILGTAAVGGYRAIEAAFAPTSLVGPALVNPGLPAMRDAVEQRPRRAWALAQRISLFSAAIVTTYVVVLALGQELVFRIFGDDFREYANLIAPVAVGQVLVSLGTGFGIALLAARRASDLALLAILNGALVVALSLPLAATHGLEGAAWGIAVAQLPPLVVAIVLARRALRSPGVDGQLNPSTEPAP